MSKPTFLSIPVELRLEVYKHIPTGPLILCCPRPGRYRDRVDEELASGRKSSSCPRPSTYLHIPVNQPVLSLGVLHVCRQIRAEAIWVLYKRVYLGSTSILVESRHIFDLERSILSSVREASIDIPDDSIWVDHWLRYTSPFGSLKHLKLFLETDAGLLPPAKKKFAVLCDELISFQRMFLFRRFPNLSMNVDVTLTIKLTWSSDPPPRSDQPPRPDPMRGIRAPSPPQHQEGSYPDAQSSYLPRLTSTGIRV